MIYLAFAVIFLSVVSAQECQPPPYRHGMSVVYGSGFVEFVCKAGPARSFLLQCVNGAWQGYVPQTCDNSQPPVRLRSSSAPPSSTTFRPARRAESKCGPAPQRADMLHYEGAGGLIVDYYCRPPRGGYYQPFAYRLVCRLGSWKGELPASCPYGVENYPKFD